ncbi:hypothetical protein BJ742DRAFT_836966, partial [Cladochytrium replicatum]
MKVQEIPPIQLDEATTEALRDWRQRNPTSQRQNQEFLTQNKAVQTEPLPFGPRTAAQHLLSELRPWGPPASCLPRKGLGLYVARPNDIKLKPLSPNRY